MFNLMSNFRGSLHVPHTFSRDVADKLRELGVEVRTYREGDTPCPQGSRELRCERDGCLFPGEGG